MGGSKNAVLAAVAVLLLAVAGIMFARQSKPAVAIADTFEYFGICLSCQQEIFSTYQKDEREPFPCPHCGDHAAFQWRFCYDCQKRVVPILTEPSNGEPRRVPPFPLCTKCKCGNLGQWHPERPDQVPLGDNPLPKWP